MDIPSAKIPLQIYALPYVCSVHHYIFADVYVSLALTGCMVDWIGRHKCLGQDRLWPVKEGTSV